MPKKILNKNYLIITYFTMTQFLFQNGQIDWVGCKSTLKYNLPVENIIKTIISILKYYPTCEIF